MSNEPLEAGTRVSTHPLGGRERSRRGTVVSPGVMLSKVDVGEDKPLTFWNFELVKVTE